MKKELKLLTKQVKQLSAGRKKRRTDDNYSLSSIDSDNVSHWLNIILSIHGGEIEVNST
mgnify:CR=1 FL=1